jgi:hypothetical protein
MANPSSSKALLVGPYQPKVLRRGVARHPAICAFFEMLFLAPVFRTTYATSGAIANAVA